VLCANAALSPVRGVQSKHAEINSTYIPGRKKHGYPPCGKAHVTIADFATS
jgi:hypothetical protein